MDTNQSVDILVIDDDSSFSDLTNMFLEKVDDSFSVATRNSGAEGVSYFESNRCEIDCIVCDYEMPGMDGLDVLDAIRESSEVPFILFTGRGSEAVASDAFSKGADDYLQKGGDESTFEVLANRINQYVEKQEYYNEQKRIQEEKNRLLERVNDVYISFNEEFEFMHLNQSGVELLNRAARRDLSYDDLIGECLWEVVPEGKGTRFEREYRMALETGLEREFEEEYEDLGIWVEVRVFPSDDGLSVFIRDITEKKAFEHEQLAGSEVLMDLYELASDSDLSGDERLCEAIRLGRDFLGVSFGFVTEISNGQQEVVLAENLVDNPELDVGAVCPIEETYCQHVLDEQEAIAVEDAGGKDSIITQVAYERFELDSYISQRVFVDDEVYGTLCFADFEGRAGKFSATEKAIAELLAGWVGYEIERQQNREELQKQNERLDAFAGLVSHDLRNPLSVAEGYLELAREERDSENLAKVSEAQTRMNEMISELLEFARSADEVVETDEVSLREMANDGWENTQTGDSSIVIETDLVIEADCSKLLNVFENLFRNAVEHNDEPVTVTIGELEQGGGFYVADDGVGIDEDEDVFAYHSEGKGRFGLLITKEIINAHGWTITQVPCEEGARFEVRF